MANSTRSCRVQKLKAQVSPARAEQTLKDKEPERRRVDEKELSSLRKDPQIWGFCRQIQQVLKLW